MSSRWERIQMETRMMAMRMRRWRLEAEFVTTTMRLRLRYKNLVIEDVFSFKINYTFIL